jgi:hypothetical protein
MTPLDRWADGCISATDKEFFFKIFFLGMSNLTCSASERFFLPSFETFVMEGRGGVECWSYYSAASVPILPEGR